LCDDIESVIGPLHAFDFKAGSYEHFLRNYAKDGSSSTTSTVLATMGASVFSY
jgi:hypothetical protein